MHIASNILYEDSVLNDFSDSSIVCVPVCLVCARARRVGDGEEQSCEYIILITSRLLRVPFQCFFFSFTTCYVSKYNPIIISSVIVDDYF